MSEEARTVARTNGATVFPADPPPGGVAWYDTDFVREYLAAARANAPIFPPGCGLRGVVTKDGLEIWSEASGVQPDHPLRVKQAVPADGGGGTHVRIVYGGVADQTPGNFHPGDTPPLILPVSGSGVVYCPVDRNSSTGALTTGQITMAASFPVSSETLGIARIATFSVQDGVVNIGQIARGSLYCTYCGGEWLWGT
jgi:hypothetical protein